MTKHFFFSRLKQKKKKNFQTTEPKMSFERDYLENVLLDG